MTATGVLLTKSAVLQISSKSLPITVRTGTVRTGTVRTLYLIFLNTAGVQTPRVYAVTILPGKEVAVATAVGVKCKST